MSWPLTNTGSRAADEGSAAVRTTPRDEYRQPVRALKGFQRAALASGEAMKVAFDLRPDAFAMWNGRNQFAVEPGKVRIWIIPNSAHGTAGAVEIVP
jgi:beta-glucosidase